MDFLSGPEIQGLAQEVVEKCRKYIPPSKVRHFAAHLSRATPALEKSLDRLARWNSYSWPWPSMRHT